MSTQEVASCNVKLCETDHHLEKLWAKRPKNLQYYDCDCCLYNKSSSTSEFHSHCCWGMYSLRTSLYSNPSNLNQVCWWETGISAFLMYFPNVTATSNFVHSSQEVCMKLSINVSNTYNCIGLQCLFSSQYQTINLVLVYVLQHICVYISHWHRINKSIP